MNIIKNQSLQWKIEQVFKVWFLVYTMLSVCNVVYGKSIISIIMWPMILLGLTILLWRLIQFDNYKKMPLIIFLFLLIISYVISLLFNWNYFSKDSLVTLVFWSFYFFILYAQNTNNEIKLIKKEFMLIGVIHLTYMFFCVIASFIMMMVNYAHVYENARGYEVASGFIWGRLWGVFIDPNSAAVMACVAICFSLFFIRNSASHIRKVFLIINIFLQITYIAFTDSRTGKVCLAVLGFIYVLLFLFYKKDSKRIHKKILYLGTACLSAVVLFLAPKAIVTAYNNVQAMTSNEGQKKIDRGYDIEDDVSNRRFDIWGSGIEILKTRPIVGTTFSGLLPYAEDNLPRTYIVNNDYKKFTTLDNEILNVLVAQGILGAVILLSFVTLIAKRILSKILKLDQQSFDIALINLTALGVIAVSAIFRAAMFYHSSPNANIFWIFLGESIILVSCERFNLGVSENNDK